MKNVVSFETANRLKEAGFPQPEPELWQIWYDTNGQEYLCLKENYYIEMDFFDKDWVSDKEAKSFTFAPTATDILRELYSIGRRQRISAMDVLNMVLSPEAAAAAWLKEHE